MIITTPSKFTLQHNKELSEIFSDMSACYQFLGNEHRFRANAYENVSKTLALMQDPIDQYADSIAHLDTLKGIGESIAEKIIEYLHTGKIKTYEKLKKKVPFQLIPLMKMEGMGPSTIRQLNSEFGIKNRKELIEALKQNKLAGHKGFGSKRISNIKRTLQIEDQQERIPLEEANRIAQPIMKKLKKINGIEAVFAAGSLRRKKETIGDIDILCTTKTTPSKKMIEAIKEQPFIKQIIVAGPTKISFSIHDSRIQVDIRLVDPDQLGAALLYFTGSKEHNIQLRSLAKQKGYKLNEYGVFKEKTGEKVAGKTEEEIYQFFGYQFIPPEKRLGRKELYENKASSTANIANPSYL